MGDSTSSNALFSEHFPSEEISSRDSLTPRRCVLSSGPHSASCSGLSAGKSVWGGKLNLHRVGRNFFSSFEFQFFSVRAVVGHTPIIVPNGEKH